MKEGEESREYRKIWKKKGKGDILELYYNLIKKKTEKKFKEIYWMMPTLFYNNNNIFSGVISTPQKVIVKFTVQDCHVEKKLKI